MESGRSESSNSGNYILVADVSDLHGRDGGMPVGELIQVMYSDGNRWIDVTVQIKSQ